MHICIDIFKDLRICSTRTDAIRLGSAGGCRHRCRTNSRWREFNTAEKKKKQMIAVNVRSLLIFQSVFFFGCSDVFLCRANFRWRELHIAKKRKTLLVFDFVQYSGKCSFFLGIQVCFDTARTPDGESSPYMIEGRESFMCVSWRIHLYVCVMAHSWGAVAHSYVCVMSHSYGRWRIHTCDVIAASYVRDMTHSYV